LEKLLEKAKQGTETDGNSNASTLRETLSMQLREQENTYGRLKNVSLNDIKKIFNKGE
jgi:hypothetical protein